MRKRQSNQYCNSRPGVVIVITLLAVLLMLGFIFYIHNLGKQTTAKIETQNAADAAVISAAGSLARSYNTVAQNNVAISKLIAQTIAIDAYPRTIRDTLNEQQVIYDAIEANYQDIPNNLWFVREPLRDMYGDMQNRGFAKSIKDEIDWLEELHNDYPGGDDNKNVDYLTRYPDGEFWQAMRSLSEVSLATLDNADALAVRAGREAATDSMHGDEAPAIMIMREGDSIPYTIGTFDDFRDPVALGLLPQQIDGRSGPNQPGYPQFRGPYDTLFAWRHEEDYQDGTGGWDGNQDAYTTGFPGSPVGRISTSGGSSSGGIPDLHYHPYGPLRDMLNGIDNLERYHLPYSRFEVTYDNLVFQKLEMLWPGVYQHARQLYKPRRVRLNNWTQGRPSSTSAVRETMFLIVEVNSNEARAILESTSKNPPSNAPPPAGHWWQYIKRPHQQNGYPVFPYIHLENNWVDITTPTGQEEIISPNPTGLVPGSANWSSITQDIWRYEAKIEDPNSSGEVAYYHWIAYVILVGTNDGPYVTANNPFEDLAPESPSAPKPVYFDPVNHPFWDGDNVPLLPIEGEVMPSDIMDKYLDARRKHLTFFAAVGQNIPTENQRLREYLDAGSMTAAVSQAYVFNNHSFDLWTQMWRSQLEPIDSELYSGWLNAPRVCDINSTGLLLYLQSTQSMAEMLKH